MPNGSPLVALKGSFSWDFRTFKKCLHHNWERVLGDEYTADIRKAWDIIFDYIFQKLTDGYHLYMADKQKNNTFQEGSAKS